MRASRRRRGMMYDVPFSSSGVMMRCVPGRESAPRWPLKVLSTMHPRVRSWNSENRVVRLSLLYTPSLCRSKMAPLLSGRMNLVTATTMGSPDLRATNSSKPTTLAYRLVYSRTYQSVPRRPVSHPPSATTMDSRGVRRDARERTRPGSKLTWIVRCSGGLGVVTVIPRKRTASRVAL